MGLIAVETLTDGEIVNKSTGEALDKESGNLVWIPNKIKLKDWFMAFQKGFDCLAMDENLKGQHYKILLKLMSKLQFENEIIIVQKELAEEMGLPSSRISEAIKVFLDRKILIKGSRCGWFHGYRLNEKYGWKGKAKNLDKRKRNRA